MTMAEVQSAHRQSLERQIVAGDSLRSKLGLACGLVVALGGFLGML